MKSSIEQVQRILDEIRPLLPIQNPMPFFVHNNPLQQWEQYPFIEGIKKAVWLYENGLESGSRVYWRDLEDFVIPVVLSYLDQGLSRWNPEGIKLNLWSWFTYYVNQSLSSRARLMGALKKERLALMNSNSMEVLVSELRRRFPNEQDWSPYLQVLIFHFKGWSGMIHVLECNPQVFPLVPLPISLEEWVAILVVTECALEKSQTKRYHPLWDFKNRAERLTALDQRCREIQKNETRYYRKIIHSLRNQLAIHSPHSLHPPLTHPMAPFESSPSKPQVPLAEESRTDLKSTFQAKVDWIFCIDDREESLRRHLEAINEDYTTYGTVGFFGADFSLRQEGQMIFQPQCPPVINPRKQAEELPVCTPNQRARVLREIWPYLNESRFTLVEPLLGIFLWPLYALALVVRSLSSVLYQDLKKSLLGSPGASGAASLNFIKGFSLEEKVQFVSDILGGMGLRTISSELVVVVGHASTTNNNVFQKAYGCGACSGQSGYPNARVFVDCANDLSVRTLLKKQGYQIQERTVFWAACHDTSMDEVTFETGAASSTTSSTATSNLTSLRSRAQKDMALALEANRKERWSQFKLPTSSTPRSRATDWSQPRPEFGHSGVALSVFGPRWLTKGLNLERRSFLVSYDPQLDPTSEHLSYSILNALPVCANINLDYFTSAAFPEVFGAGSKLPLNVAAGLGLMSGSKGDLRIGLATQMVDQHEPLRLLAFVYCDSEKLKTVIAKSPRLERILKNNWIHLIRIDPDTHQFEGLTEEIANDLALFS